MSSIYIMKDIILFDVRRAARSVGARGAETEHTTSRARGRTLNVFVALAHDLWMARREPIDWLEAAQRLLVHTIAVAVYPEAVALRRGCGLEAVVACAVTCCQHEQQQRRPRHQLLK